MRKIGRRSLLTAGAVAVAAAGSGVWARGRQSDPVVIPQVPAGEERVERRQSAARGQGVDFYTAVPAGYYAGRGLPVCLVLHGGSKRPADFAALGLGKFLTDAVRRGAPPFVLAGATGDRLAWRPNGDDDPQRMVREELPRWCAERGYDAKRLAAWGWSMGGYGSLLLAGTFPGLLRSAAAFSPSVRAGDAVYAQLPKLASTPIGLWCGTDDDALDNVQALEKALPVPPAVGGYRPGRHNFGYWSTLLPEAFTFVGRSLR